ncbi:MAG: fumarylacetoacetase [Propionibacteriaceae bacterium]
MSWFEVPDGAPFGTFELPYGVYVRGTERPRVGVAVGDRVLDLAGMWRAGGDDPTLFEQPSLNAFLAAGRTVWAVTRERLQAALADASGQSRVEPYLLPSSEARMLLPFEVADYVDFYASVHHATNVGRIFRPGGPPLTPNWHHLPIGYHGRAGTVVVSGTAVPRPCGQVLAPGAAAPTFGPSSKLDFEAELGWVVGVGSAPGEAVAVQAFADHVFGAVIVNDWSARDLQAWEYVPLGPFLGKSFATSISAWVLPLDALIDAEVEPPAPEVERLAYLSPPGRGYDVDVEVEINGQRVSRCPYAAMTYTPAQLLAHLSVNGARLRTGDLFASGTISGPAPDQWGSLLELGWNGTRPLDLGAGTSRAFLADGDEVVLRAVSRGARPAHLGEVRGCVLPSRLG